MAEGKTIYGDDALAADPTSDDPGGNGSGNTDTAKSGARLLYPNLPTTQEGASGRSPADGEANQQAVSDKSPAPQPQSSEQEASGRDAPANVTTGNTGDAELEQRAQARVDRAMQQVETNAGAWAAISINPLRWYPKCNEFVYDAHVNGDPQGSGFPTVLRDSPHNILNNDYYKLYEFGRYIPTVNNFADPQFASDRLEYIPDINQVRKGDIVVWYGEGKDGKFKHHSAIAAGDGNVLYAGDWGAKNDFIENLNNEFGVTPIIRRYK